MDIAFENLISLIVGIALIFVIARVMVNLSSTGKGSDRRWRGDSGTTGSEGFSLFGDGDSDGGGD